jgi:hypothetical protein
MKMGDNYTGYLDPNSSYSVLRSMAYGRVTRYTVLFCVYIYSSAISALPLASEVF